MSISLLLSRRAAALAAALLLSAGAHAQSGAANDFVQVPGVYRQVKGTEIFTGRALRYLRDSAGQRGL